MSESALDSDIYGKNELNIVNKFYKWVINRFYPIVYSTNILERIFLKTSVNIVPLLNTI